MEVLLAVVEVCEALVSVEVVLEVLVTEVPDVVVPVVCEVVVAVVEVMEVLLAVVKVCEVPVNVVLVVVVCEVLVTEVFEVEVCEVSLPVEDVSVVVGHASGMLVEPWPPASSAEHSLLSVPVTIFSAFEAVS